MKKIFFYFLILLITAGFIGAFWFVFEVLNPVRSDKAVDFSIKSGEGVNQISASLKKQGIIKSSLVFETYAYLKDIEGNFKAGEYSLPAVINIKRLVELLTSIESANNPELVVPEGFTVQEIDDKLVSMSQFSAREFATAAARLNAEPKFLDDYNVLLSDKPAGSSLEGYLFPDTYFIFSYSTPDDIIRKMLTNFEEKLTDDLREEIERQKKTIFEIITVASIIEEEVKTDADRAIVSGIIWKRLATNMPLQVDSTVKYITGGSTALDQKVISPYNTYLNQGLPPGPICNPGLAAIKAAIYPEASDHWFFLTELNNEGTVHYAKNFEEHKKNIAEYLQ